jgi:hypothetical protein
VALFGVVCVFYGLFGHPRNATEWVMAGNALIFCGLTMFLILLNFALSRANWTLAQSQGLHTFLAVSPSLSVQPALVFVEGSGLHRATLLNNSSAPAHYVRMLIWPVSERYGDPPFEIGSGNQAFVGEMLPFAQQEVSFFPRQPVVPLVDDLRQGTEIATHLHSQGVIPVPGTFVWKLEWSDAAYQPRSSQGAHLVRIPIPPDAMTP